MLIARRSAVASRLTTGRLLAAIILAVTAGAVLVPGSRHRVLTAAGRALVSDDPLAPADVVVVSVEAGPGGILEAADLVHQGMAPRVAVVAEVSSRWEAEFARRGVTYEDAPAASERYLKLLGVSDVQRIPGGVDGTHTEAALLRDWSAQRHIRSLIVVSAADHSRRVRRVLRRELRGSPVVAHVRAARFSSFDPESWWRTRTGIRTGIVEGQKLVLDLASHPLS